MNSALADAAQAPVVSPDNKYGWLKAHLGSLAIAFAIVFGAGVWGFISSLPFAMFFEGLVLFAVLFGVAIALFTSGEWLGVLFGLGFFVASLMILFGAAEESLRDIRTVQAAKIAASSVP